MQGRFVSLWFRHLTTDWLTLRRPELKSVPFVFVVTLRNRVVVTAANNLAESLGVTKGMAAADAKAIIPGLEVVDAIPEKEKKL
ncbi:MAG: DNA polymerase Y family protein, partial [Pedobacter sp.]